MTENDLREALMRRTAEQTCTLSIIARYLSEHDAPGLAERLADGGIDLPDVNDIHGDWCLCAACRPDAGPLGRMVAN